MAQIDNAEQKNELENEMIHSLMNDFKKKNDNIKLLRKLIPPLVTMTFFVSLFSVLLVYSPAFNSDGVQYVDKAEIKKKLTSVIKNGASLDLVKHIYETREFQSFMFMKESNKQMYYTENTTLSVILNDIMVDYMSVEDYMEDTVYYSNLCDIIIENQYHNPFDNLEDVQISYFDNLRIKTGDKYDDIQNDVVKIATELKNKNQLVSKYLNRSNNSFIISLIALIITIIVSFIQIFQGVKLNNRLDSASITEAPEDKSDKDI